jgi:hypothetical protein
MSKEAIAHYEAALKEAFPRGATGEVFHHWNEARYLIATEALDRMAENARELGLDYEPAPATELREQEPVAWPAGLIERIKAAEQRIQDGHAPRRIPADPTDVDLVLAEVRYLLEGKQPPFWVNTSPPTLSLAQRQARSADTWVSLTDEQVIKTFNAICNGKPFNVERILELHRAIEAELKENNCG